MKTFITIILLLIAVSITAQDKWGTIKSIYKDLKKEAKRTSPERLDRYDKSVLYMEAIQIYEKAKAKNDSARIAYMMYHERTKCSPCYQQSVPRLEYNSSFNYITQPREQYEMYREWQPFDKVIIRKK